MKKIVFTLAAVAALSLASCGDKQAANDTAEIVTGEVVEETIVAGESAGQAAVNEAGDAVNDAEQAAADGVQAAKDKGQAAVDAAKAKGEAAVDAAKAKGADALQKGADALRK